MSRNNKQPVIVEGKTFDSMYDAAKFIGADASCIRWALFHNKDRKYKDLSVSFADRETEEKIVQELASKPVVHRKRKVKTDKKHSCPVYCENSNKTFKTISDAAKYAKVNGWTMSLKMATAGQFVDKDGNVYKRLKPMNTKNTYNNTGDTLQKNVLVKRHRKATPIVETKPIEIVEAEVNPIELMKQHAQMYLNKGDYHKAGEFCAALCKLTNQ